MDKVITIQDLIITPIWLIIIGFGLYIVRGYIRDPYLKKYFIPAAAVKVFSAILLGLVYQYYYKGGDTLFYFENSRVISEALINSPVIGLKLLFTQGGTYYPETFEYAQQMHFYLDPSSYGLVKLAGFLNLFSFNTYSTTAVFVALIGFSGCVALYKVFTKFYPQLHKAFALSVFFLPSVFFWGSGLLKDTIVLGALGWFIYAVSMLFLERKRVLRSVLILIIAGYVIYVIKIYVLLSALPAVAVWIAFQLLKQFKSPVTKLLFGPIIFISIVVGGYYLTTKTVQNDRKYAFENIASTAKTSSDYLSQLSKRDEGSGYSLGAFDPTIGGMLKKFFPAVIVTLYRPFVWETNSVFMLFSALESLFFLLLTAYVFFKAGVSGFLRGIRTQPFVLFCLLFSLTFAFAVGISTYNFGTLVRYKIPLMPFYPAALFIILHLKKKRRIQSVS